MSEHHARRSPRLFWLIALLAVVVALCVVLLTRPDPGKTDVPSAETDGTTAQITENPSETESVEATQPETVVEETTEQVTEEPTESLQYGIEDQPAALTALLEHNHVTYEDLAQAGCTQLIVVVADGTSAQIRFFSCGDGLWQTLVQLDCRGRVGRSGVYMEKHEGDGSTPAGLYGLGSAFYIHNAPETALDVFQITSDTYWVDDPDSVFYNQRVEGLENKDWDSAEHMIDYGVYRYGFVVNYNVAAEYNAGSAIFFHIGDRPTAGCIAVEEQMVLAYLAELDKARNPHILIMRGDGLDTE